MYALINLSQLTQLQLSTKDLLNLMILAENEESTDLVWQVPVFLGCLQYAWHEYGLRLSNKTITILNSDIAANDLQELVDLAQQPINLSPNFSSNLLDHFINSSSLANLTTNQDQDHYLQTLTTYILAVGKQLENRLVNTGWQNYWLYSQLVTNEIDGSEIDSSAIDDLSLTSKLCDISNFQAKPGKYTEISPLLKYLDTKQFNNLLVQDFCSHFLLDINEISLVDNNTNQKAETELDTNNLTNNSSKLVNSTKITSEQLYQALTLLNFYYSCIKPTSSKDKLQLDNSDHTVEQSAKDQSNNYSTLLANVRDYELEQAYLDLQINTVTELPTDSYNDYLPKTKENLADHSTSDHQPQNTHSHNSDSHITDTHQCSCTGHNHQQLDANANHTSNNYLKRGIISLLHIILTIILSPIKLIGKILVKLWILVMSLTNWLVKQLVNYQCQAYQLPLPSLLSKQLASATNCLHSIKSLKLTSVVQHLYYQQLFKFSQSLELEAKLNYHLSVVDNLQNQQKISPDPLILIFNNYHEQDHKHNWLTATSGHSDYNFSLYALASNNILSNSNDKDMVIDKLETRVVSLYDLISLESLVNSLAIWESLGRYLASLHYQGISLTNSACKLENLIYVNQQWIYLNFTTVSFYLKMGKWADQDLSSILDKLNTFNQKHLGYFSLEHWQALLDAYQNYFQQIAQAQTSKT